MTPKQTSEKNTFIPGKTYIPASGKVFGREEIANGIAAVKDGWWTEGRFAIAFEKEFSKIVGAKYVSLTNSGSSSNLLAISALTSTVLGERSLQPGDEIITSATCFPTTVNPIIQNRCIPVFVDIDPATKNPSEQMVERAITKKTKAIILAHTLGNPIPLEPIMRLAQYHHLWLIEDACDALGSTYQGKPIGSFGDMATFSFYPAHQITMGEGGAIVTNNPLLYRAIRQFRDWGRDCWCDTGADNSCGRRFAWKIGDLPMGYDHKYIYSQIGYNLKLTDMQAAIGLAQLKKLPDFTKKRIENFHAYDEFFSRYPGYFTRTEALADACPNWFGFMITIRDTAPFTRLEFATYLEKNKIGTRNLFAGNILKHPAYLGRKDIRISGDLTHADTVMDQGFWIGVYPGITQKMREYVMKTVEGFLLRFR